MVFKILEGDITYTGKELRSGWVQQHTGQSGDAAAGFVGPCHVANEDLVDLDDARAGTFIAARRMAHVIAEFNCDIQVAVLRQRLMVARLCECLAELDRSVLRRGDDVYYAGRKLTVSIAAPSAAQTCLIHLGINIDPDGAPVPAVGLAEMSIDAGRLLDTLLTRFSEELTSCERAERKVRKTP
jgi:hypothetical protein